MTQINRSLRPDDLGLKQQLHSAIKQVNGILLGKTDEVKLAWVCLLAGGHLLIEDLPGMGKTTLAHALAATAGLSFQRIQFTSDLLPSDITGVSTFDREKNGFTFHPGPIFSQVLMADEINRATPKAQSALLEAMAEETVTIDGETRHLPKPFFVIATQNPVDLAGTFPLPESQQDRFLLRISLGYPSREAEREMLLSKDRRELLAELTPQLNTQSLTELRRHADAVKAAPALLDYLQALIDATRSHSSLRQGLSPRAGIALLRAARAHAFIDDRDFCLPEDIQKVFVAVAAHRLMTSGDSSDSERITQDILHQTAVD